MQSGGFGMEPDTGSNKMQWYVSVNGSYRTPGGTIAVGEYFHFAGTYDGETIKCYINGVLMEEEACAGSFTFPSNESAQYMSIGADSSSGGTGEAYHRGTIATANIYSTVLDEVQAAALYQNYAK